MTETTSRPSLYRARATDHLAVAVGTTKGLFLISDGVVDGPWFKGQHVGAFLQIDGHYMASVTDRRFGASIRTSADAGLTWSEPTHRPIAMPEETGESLVQVWQLHADGNRIFAGAEPATLFTSDDLGETFELVESLWDHPHRKQWEPDGGLGLHTIVTHPDRPNRIIVGISTGGVYRSDDGGSTWTARNSGISAAHLPEPDAEFGQCVHKIAIDAEGPDVLWLQNHWGIYRSENAGDSWQNVGHPGEAHGVASDFGFPIVAHPDEPGTAFVFPLESDEYRCSPEGRCQVYRTSDAGKSWERLTRGLPASNAHLTVLRDAFDVGREPPFPLVFGTRTGQIFASADGGEHWRLVSGHMPPILCVRVLA